MTCQVPEAPGAARCNDAAWTIDRLPLVETPIPWKAVFWWENWDFGWVNVTRVRHEVMPLSFCITGICCFSSVFVFVLFGKILAESTRQQSEVQKWKLATLERNHLSLRIIWTTSMSFHKLLGKAQHRFGQLCSWGFPEFVFWTNGHGIWRLKRNSWVAISFSGHHTYDVIDVYFYLHMLYRLMREKDYKCSWIFFNIIQLYNNIYIYITYIIFFLCKTVFPNKNLHRPWKPTST